eukprot:7176466-Ditylum_brightwellii.AAC.1
MMHGGVIWLNDALMKALLDIQAEVLKDNLIEQQKDSMKETLMDGQMVCLKAVLMNALWDALKANVTALKIVIKIASAMDLLKD